QPSKKAKRKRITPEQLVDLLALFEKTDTPSFEVREKLANQLNMTNREVQVWFQNRRAKVNRARLNAMNAENAQSQHRTSSSPYHRRSHSHSYSLPPTPAYSDHSAIDLLASAAEYVQKSEEKRKR
ncbi:homeobox domain-containing protein, partial [Umbelopsis sp. AD052]